MSVQDLYNQTNVQLEAGAVASEHHGDNETERIKRMEFHIKAGDEDAAGSIPHKKINRSLTDINRCLTDISQF